MLSVYLTNTEIRAVSGSVIGGSYRVGRVWRQKLPQDAYRNGEVTDAALLKGAVSEFWKQNRLPRTANLVVNGSRFILKTMDAPRLHGRRLRAFIAREYSELDRRTQPVFTCFPLSENLKKRTQRLLTAVGERPYLKELLAVFRAAGVRIAAADSSLGCSIRVLSSLPALKKKTCIVQLLESESLTSLLFVNGEYAYSMTNRITAAPDTFEFGIGVARIVSSILQFSRAQYADDAVTEVLLGGFSADSAEVCVESIAQMDSTLEVSSISGVGTEAFHEMIPVVGGLTMPQRIPLLKELRNRNEKSRNPQEALGMVLPAAAALLILGTAAGMLLLRQERLRTRLEELNGSLTNPRYIAAGAAYDDYEEKLRALEGLTADAETAIRYIGSYPLPTSEAADAICRCADGFAAVRIDGYDAAKGTYSLAASAEQAAAVSRYIERLRQEAAFAEVSYTGYSYDERTERWNVQVVCTLAADAGRP